MDLIYRPLSEILDIVRGDREALSDYIHRLYERIERVEERIRSFITLRPLEHVLREALEANRLGKPLAGIPIAVKDNISTMGIRTTCASAMLQNYVPPYDATVVKRLREAGAVIMGKTNMDEFAMGSTTETSFFGPTRNPWDLERVPGGSSGGSGAAVSAGLAPIALGSDTGGSVRNPAAFTSTFGYKPTYGGLSRYGLIAYASSLDQVGIVARSSRDVELVMEIMKGLDPRDPTSIDLDLRISRRSGKPVVFLVKEMWEYADKRVSREAMRALEKAFNALEEVSVPETGLALPAYYVIAFAEAGSNLARYGVPIYGLSRDPEGVSWREYYSEVRSRGFGREVKRRIMLGSYVLSAGYYEQYYIKALKVRRLLKEKLSPLLEKGFIASPTMPITPPRIGEAVEDPLKLYAMDLETVIPNLVGAPAISIPAGLVDSLPVGLQIMALPGMDGDLLGISAYLEEALGLRAEIPPLG